MRKTFLTKSYLVFVTTLYRVLLNILVNK